MPTYDYTCTHCGHSLEAFQSITAKPLRKCPACGKMTLQRKIGAGAALIFKGSGFYQTDYKKATAPESKEAAGDKGSAAKEEKVSTKTTSEKKQTAGSGEKKA